MDSLPLSAFVMALVLMAMVPVATTTACHVPPPATLAPDLQAEGECIVAELIAGNTAVSSIAGKCTGGDEKLAVDLIDWAISSLTTAAKIPVATAATVRAEVERRRALPAH
jgi:hypothetical protein